MKDIKRNLKRRAGLFAISTMIGISTLAGCTKKEAEINMDNVSFYVENFDRSISSHDSVGYVNADIRYNLANYNSAVFTKYIDLSTLPEYTPNTVSTVNNFNPEEKELLGDSYSTDYVYPLTELKATNNQIVAETGYVGFAEGLFRQIDAKEMVSPDSYKWAEDYYRTGRHSNSCCISVKIEELAGVYGNYYVNLEYDVKFLKDVNVPNGVTYVAGNSFYETYGIQKPIYEGDTMSYKAIYLVQNNENNTKEYKLVANEQTGLGSDCENVSTIMNNYSEVYKEIGLTEDGVIKFDNMQEFKDYIIDQSVEKKAENVKKLSLRM